MIAVPSLHDNFLVSYEVNCEARQIKLRATRDPRIPGNELQRDRTIVFNGVEGYQFENDAFGNIIFSLQRIPVGQLIVERGGQIAESYRMTGAPAWAADLGSAAQALAVMGMQAFDLNASYGLSGWILAKEVLVEQE
ncbi:hypothetical protein [Afipia sp. GAS231]|uniref:hypothetical protein n=1 Tax=Afipia sp. GAS231 TaxID=1882747 RepID=UPI000B85F4B9|nr:hypothetical protein [Afipia sp. GAS231]